MFLRTGLGKRNPLPSPLPSSNRRPSLITSIKKPSSSSSSEPDVSSVADAPQLERKV